MKKLICIVFCLIALCLGLGVNAFADGGKLSDDLQTLTLDGKTYHRCNTLVTEYWGYDTDIPLKAPDGAVATAYPNEDASLVDVELLYKDGSRLSMGFIRENYIQEYDRLLTTTDGSCCVPFYWGAPELSLEVLKSSPVTLDSMVLYWAETYPVQIYAKNDSFSVIRGTLLIDGDSYYYVDHQELGVINRRDFSTYEAEEMSAYKITDPETLASLKEIRKQEGGVRIIGSDFMQSISAAMLTLVFALFPAAVLVLSLIFGFRRKGSRKNAWRTICALCAAELIVFTLIVIIL